MHIRGIDLDLLKKSINLQQVPVHIFMANSIYVKPNGISMQMANKMLVTFAFTRHPFKRLVSAYNDKFKHRMSHQPTKFAKLVIKEILSNRIKPNNHYRPQYLACPYCQLDFDLVGNLEDMKNHTAFIARHLGLKVKGVLYAVSYTHLTLPTNREV